MKVKDLFNEVMVQFYKLSFALIEADKNKYLENVSSSCYNNKKLLARLSKIENSIYDLKAEYWSLLEKED